MDPEQRQGQGLAEERYLFAPKKERRPIGRTGDCDRRLQFGGASAIVGWPGASSQVVGSEEHLPSAGGWVFRGAGQGDKTPRRPSPISPMTLYVV